MATLRQIQANRRNSQNSTGPRTPAGKAAARFNALKTGIDAQSLVIPGESSDDLQALAAEYHQRFQPGGPEERMLIDNLVANEWQLRRLRKAEAQLWTHQIAAFGDEPDLLGQAFSGCRESLTRLQRRLDSTDRSSHRALRELERRQSARPAAQPEAPAPSMPDTTAASPSGTTDNPEIGFVPSPPSAGAPVVHIPLGGIPGRAPRLPSAPQSASPAAQPSAKP